MGTKSIGSLMKPNAVVASEIKLKQNCFVSVVFQFYFRRNHCLTVTGIVIIIIIIIIILSSAFMSKSELIKSYSSLSKVNQLPTGELIEFH